MFEEVEIIYLKGEPAYGSYSKELANSINLDTALFGPSTISWEKFVDYSTPLEYLGLKEVKKIDKSLSYAQELGISINLNEKVTEDDYSQWIQIYKNNIQEKETGTVWIDENWLQNLPSKIAEKYGSIIIKDKQNKVLGGALIKRKEKENTISCDFRAHEYIKFKDSGLSALIEYALDAYAIKFGYKRITRGADENLYGIRLARGLEEFKRHYRFKPIPLDNHGSYRPRVLVFFQEFENILTYCYKNNEVNKELEAKSISKTIPIKYKL